MTPLIDVCVATYKRPEGLARLLESLVTQDSGGRFRFAVRIADNDALGSAEPTVRMFEGRGIEVSYAIEPRQSVSHARNRSVSLAKGEFIATTDDDLLADPRWLFGLYDAAIAHGADVVHGPVISRFPAGTPAYLEDSFRKPSPPTGSTSGYWFSTANSFFRRSLIQGVAEPFDPRCGRTGGEDTQFFNGLRDRGCKMIWSREAIVYSPLSPERATLRSLLRRRLQFGNTSARFGHDRSGPLHLVSLTGWIVVTAGLGLLYLTGGLFSRRLRIKGLSRLAMALQLVASMIGRLAHYAGIHFEQYVEH
jgi:succinoglycan biosynthesis protein ExoM